MISLNVTVHTPNGLAVVNWRMVQRIELDPHAPEHKRVVLHQSGAPPLFLVEPPGKPDTVDWNAVTAWSYYETGIAKQVSDLAARQRLVLPE